MLRGLAGTGRRGHEAEAAGGVGADRLGQQPLGWLQCPTKVSKLVSSFWLLSSTLTVLAADAGMVTVVDVPLRTRMSWLLPPAVTVNMALMLPPVSSDS